MWSVPVRFVVMWAPIIAVSVGGGIYLYECTDTLLAPGTGFTFDYATPEGPLKIECATYSIDLLQQTIVANKLVIKKPDGTLVARVPQLVAKGIAVDEGLTPKVQIKDAELWANRDAKGDLDLLKFLTPSEGGASQQPWQISIRDSKVHLRDWSAPGGLRNEVLISTGNFVGMGENTQGSVSLEIPGLIKGLLNFKRKPGLTTLSGSGIEAHLEPILTRLRAGHEREQIKLAEPLRLAGGKAAGNFLLEVPEKGRVRFTSDVNGNAKSVRWDNYAVDDLEFKGSVTELGLTGSAKIRQQGLTGDAVGTLGYGKETTFGGNVKVAGLTPKHLEDIKLKLPKNLAFSSSDAEGYLTFEKGMIGWKGKASITSPSAFGLKAPKVEADLSLNKNQLLATIQPITIGKTVVSGDLGYNLKTQAIFGSISTPQADAKDFAQWLPQEVLTSKGQLAALIDGTVSKPNILVKGTIDPRIKLSDRLVDLHNATVVLRYDGGKFRLERLAVQDQVGSLYASGDIDLKKGLNVRVVANGIDLEKLVKDSSGKFDVQGQILGTLKEPRYVGKVQGYGIGYSGLPGKILAVASDFSGNQESVSFSAIEAMKGAAQITGSIGIGLSDQKLAGMFAVNGIDIRDLYDGPVGGVLDIKNIAVSGTVGNPLVEGSFEAKKVLAYNFSADTARGKVKFDGENFHITEGEAQFAKGAISNLHGDISAKTISGKISGDFNKLDLSEVSQSALAAAKVSDGGSELPEATNNIAVKGTTSGSFEVGLQDKTFASLSSKGRVDDVRLNKAFVGSGEWDTAFDGKQWSLNALIGSLDEYFRVDNAVYTPETGAIGGEFLSYRIPVQELLVAAEPSLGLSDENLEKLHLVDGKLASLLQFSGTTKNPTVEIPEFEISGIKLGKQDLGNFSIKGIYADRNFSFSDGLLEGPKNARLPIPYASTFTLPDKIAPADGTAKLAGSIKESGDLDITGSIFGFPVDKFSTFAPALDKMDVFINRASFALKGSREKPVLNSNFEVTANLTPDGKKTTGIMGSPLKVNADVTAQPVAKVEDGTMKIDATGGFNLSSIKGTLDSHFFLNSDFGLAQQAPVDIRVLLDGNRDVSSFFKEVDGIALGDDGATLTGGLTVSNTFANKVITGGVDLHAGSVKYNKIQEIIGRPIDLNLRDVVGSAKIESDAKLGQVLRTQFSTTSNYSKGAPNQNTVGYVKFDAKVPIDDLFKESANQKDFLNREIVDGTFQAKRFGIYQGFLQGSYLQATLDTADGQPVKIAGTLGKPKIGGDIYFDEVKTIIPTLNPTKSGTEESSLDPTFDLRFHAKNPMNIKSSLAEINAKGDGSLTGTLSNLKANGELTVESGTLTLPGGNVKLSPDGTLTLRYEATSFNNRAQLLANLHGETSLTALKNGVTPERYDISLDVKGDLMGNSSQGLALTASSQPGDLSQDRILQLLGRTDILTNLLQSGVSSSVESDIRNAATSFLLPSVLNGITNDIAKGFGLDYFGVDYNVFEQASLSFVKGLGSDFFLQGRRQLSQPLPGQPIAYDFRLAFRPRRGPNAIRALSFSLGTDQLRPYKLSIDFSNRIRTTKPTYQSIKLHVPNK